MLAPIELPSSAVARRVASTKWLRSRAGSARDRALDPFGRQGEIGVAGEVAGQEFGGVDDHAGIARLDRAQNALVAGDDNIAAQHQIGAGRGDADGVNVVRRIGDADMAVDRAAFLREAGHVDDADALALKMRRHADDGADGDDAGAADAGDDDAVRMIDQRDGRRGQSRPVLPAQRRFRLFSTARHAR